MPRIKCPKCSRDETVLKSGFVRGLQRYFCKACEYHFTLVKRKQPIVTKRKKRQTTIIDIAKAVGVSVSTVSRALKDHDDISEKTKAMVKQVAVELDYQPNLVALSLNSRETHTIGVVVPDIENPFFASILSGIQHAASASGYKVMICQSDESHKTEVMNLQAMMNNWVDGLLICHSKETRSFEHVKLQLKKGIPIIHFDRICEEMETSKVLLDNVDGAEQIVSHLMEQGFKRIAVMAGPKHLYITQKRLEGYRKALEKHRITFDESIIAYTDFTRKSIHNAVDTWLQCQKKPDAIFCISDNSAIIAMMHLKQKGVRIPHEMAIAGFGNDYTSEIIEPTLTSFDSFSFKIGETAVALFFEQVIAGEKFVSKTETIRGKLIIRNSTLRVPKTKK